MMPGEAGATLRGVATEFQCEFEQLRGGGGGTSDTCDFGCDVEGVKGLRVTGRRREGEVACSQLRLGHDLGQPSMHRPSLRDRGTGIDATCQEGMSEAHAVTVDGDDALVLSRFEQTDRAADVTAGRHGHLFDRRHRNACRGQQHLSNVVFQTADSGLHQLGQSVGQHAAAACLGGFDHPRQLERVKRVPA